jgi:hypothetical protein
MGETNPQNTTVLDSFKGGRSSKMGYPVPIVGVVLALLLGAGLVLPIPHFSVPGFGRALGVLLDMMHGPAFALFAAILVPALHKRTPLQPKTIAIGAWIFMVGGGCLTEIVQSFIGRSASWHDVAANTLGVTAGVLWASGRTYRSRQIRRRTTAVAILLLCVAAARVPIVLADCLIQQMERPMLASFERPLEMIRWKSHNCKISRVNEHATHGRFAIRLEPGEKDYSAFYCRKPLAGWSDYKTLAVDVAVDVAHGNAGGPEEVQLIVQIQDHISARTSEPSDRYERLFRLRPGTHEMKISLADVADAPQGREMDLDSISVLCFTLINLDRPHVLHIDNVRLE